MIFANAGASKNINIEIIIPVINDANAILEAYLTAKSSRFNFYIV